MPEIFISYRREDSSGHAGRLFDRMRERFGDESVFMDVTDIQAGVDFTTALDNALASCRVVLIVIGTQWLTCTDPSGRRRLDDPGDHLRLEIVRALARDARVIPVLVRGATMPREHDLPDDLRPLARRQAHEISDSRWSFDADRLIRIVESHVGPIGGDYERLGASRPATPGDGAVAPSSVHRSRLVMSAAVLLGVLALAGAGAWLTLGDRTGTSPESAPNDPSGTARPAGGSAPPAVAFRKQPSREKSPARLPASGEVRAGALRFRLLGGLVSGDVGNPHTVRLFVRTTNVGAPYGGGISPDSFRLIVDGQATPPTESPILVIPMQSANDSWVTFPVPPNAGAVVLQVGDIRHETATIPIDLRAAGTNVTDTPDPVWRYPVDLAATFEKRAGPLVYTLDGARLEHFADAVPPLQPEKLLLTLKMRIKNVGLPYGAVVSGELFRLLVDGVPLAPTKFPIQALGFQASLDGDVEFVMPGSAMNAILQVGILNAETVKVPLDLAAAR